MSNPPVLVWCEIPVTDMEKACDFYAKVFGYKMEIDTNGPNPMAVLNGMSEATAGHLYPGSPSEVGSGNTVHLAILNGDSVENAAKRAEENGGTVGGPIIEIEFGRWQYGTDPDGNSIGLFEPVKAA